MWLPEFHFNTEGIEGAKESATSSQKDEDLTPQL